MNGDICGNDGVWTYRVAGSAIPFLVCFEREVVAIVKR